MLRQIKLLTDLQIKGLFGSNNSNKNSNKKKNKENNSNRTRRTMIIYCIIGVIIGIVFGFFFKLMEIPHLAPAFMFEIISLWILVFTLLRAGNVIFDLGNFRQLLSLPVSNKSIIISRFMSVYVVNELMVLSATIPVMIILRESGRFMLLKFYVWIFGAILAPFIPMILGMVIGALTQKTLAKLKYGTALRSIGLTVFSGATWFILYFGDDVFSALPKEKQNRLMDIAYVASQKAYPPAIMFSEAINGNMLSFITLFFCSILIFSVGVWLIQRKFLSLVESMNYKAKGTSRVTIESKSILRSLVERELRIFLNTPAYMSKTLGPAIGGMIIVIVVSFFGVGWIEEAFPVKSGVAIAFVPIIIIFMQSIVPATNFCISIEGRYWWQLMSLPISTRKLYTAKLINALIVFLPLFLLSVIIATTVFRPNILLFISGLCYMVTSFLYKAVIYLSMDASNPCLNWNTESELVRNNSNGCLVAVMEFTLLIGLIIALFLSGEYAFAVYFAATVIQLGIAYFSWQRALDVELIVYGDREIKPTWLDRIGDKNFKINWRGVEKE